jgi:CheY-like chemotaxis protein
MADNGSMTTLNPIVKDQVCILVADDHPKTAAILAHTLSQLGEGVNIISAFSVRDALKKVRTVGVNILFSAMIMLEATGLELIEKMHSHLAGRPAYTYLVTAYDQRRILLFSHCQKMNFARKSFFCFCWRKSVYER